MTRHTADDYKNAVFAIHPEHGPMVRVLRLWEGEEHTLDDHEMAVAGARVIPVLDGYEHQNLLDHIHEQDRTIRKRNATINELREKAKAVPTTAQEALDLAWDLAIVPEDGMIHDGEEYIVRGDQGLLSAGRAACTVRATTLCADRRLLVPRPPKKEWWEYDRVRTGTVDTYRAGVLDGEEVWVWENPPSGEWGIIRTREQMEALDPTGIEDENND